MHNIVLQHILQQHFKSTEICSVANRSICFLVALSLQLLYSIILSALEMCHTELGKSASAPFYLSLSCDTPQSHTVIESRFKLCRQAEGNYLLEFCFAGRAELCLLQSLLLHSVWPSSARAEPSCAVWQSYSSTNVSCALPRSTHCVAGLQGSSNSPGVSTAPASTDAPSPPGAQDSSHAYSSACDSPTPSYFWSYWDQSGRDAPDGVSATNGTGSLTACVCSFQVSLVGSHSHGCMGVAMQDQAM